MCLQKKNLLRIADSQRWFTIKYVYFVCLTSFFLHRLQLTAITSPYSMAYVVVVAVQCVFHISNAKSPWHTSLNHHIILIYCLFRINVHKRILLQKIFKIKFQNDSVLLLCVMNLDTFVIPNIQNLVSEIETWMIVRNWSQMKIKLQY